MSNRGSYFKYFIRGNRKKDVFNFHMDFRGKFNSSPFLKN